MTPQEIVDRLRREHDDARVVAEALEGATADTAGGVAELFLEFFDDFSWDHFPTEEATLLPALPRDDDGLALAERVRVEHAWLRVRAAALRKASDDDPGALRGLGVLLREHLELEESELFGRIAGVRG